MYITHCLCVKLCSRVVLCICVPATMLCGGFKGPERGVYVKIMCMCGVVYLCAFNCVVWWFPGAREGDPTTRPGAIPRGGNIGATRTKVALSRSLNQFLFVICPDNINLVSKRSQIAEDSNSSTTYTPC